MSKYIAKGDISWPDDEVKDNRVRWKVGDELPPKIGTLLALYAKELVEVVEAEAAEEAKKAVVKKKKK